MIETRNLEPQDSRHIGEKLPKELVEHITKVVSEYNKARQRPEKQQASDKG